MNPESFTDRKWKTGNHPGEIFENFNEWKSQPDRCRSDRKEEEEAAGTVTATTSSSARRNLAPGTVIRSSPSEASGKTLEDELGGEHRTHELVFFRPMSWSSSDP